MTVNEIAEQMLLIFKSRFEGEETHSVFMATIKVAHALSVPAGLVFETKIRVPKPRKA
jgi:hypothetical protein